MFRFLRLYTLRTRGIFRGGASPPHLSTLLFSEKEQNECCQVTEVYQALLMAYVVYAFPQGRRKAV